MATKKVRASKISGSNMGLVSADWKDLQGFFDNLQVCLESLKIPYLVPVWRGNGDSFSIIIGNAPFTESAAKEIFGVEESKFEKLARLHRDLAHEYETNMSPYSHTIAAILDEITEAEKE